MGKFLKIIGWVFVAFTSIGFRTFGDAVWDINSTDNKLFVNFCNSITLTENDLPSNAPLASSTISFATVTQSIYNDYNNLSSTFVQLVDISDSDYDVNLHSERVIDICVGGTSAPASSGEASLSTSGLQITGCKITLTSAVTDSTKDFIGTLTHELGHCLGLDHPQESTKSVMSYFSDSDTIRLQDDDKIGLIHLYPTNPSEAKEETTFGLSCTPN